MLLDGHLRRHGQRNSTINSTIKMTSAHKKMLFFYIIVVVVRNACGSCNTTFNPLHCVYDITCRGRFLLDIDFSEFRYNNRPQLSDLENPSICKTIRNIHSDNYEYYQINLKQKNNLNAIENESVPLVSDNDYYNRGYSELIYVITNIDLSSDTYNAIPELRQMDNLEFLDLSRNLLTVAELSNTFELSSLKEINLSHNTISKIDYQSVHIYKGLKKIDLSYNYITKITEAVFDPFDDLETLDISHNYIDTLSTLTFDGMKQLINLNISYNRITDINASLVRFIGLKLLDLSNNRIKTVKASDFNRLANIETLDLNSNIISIIEKESFQNMAVLSSLYINNNKLENIDKEMLNNNSHLVSINLSGNLIKKLPRGLFKSKTIQNFSIEGNLLEGSIDKGTFEGLFLVDELDLRSQHLDSIQDYSFYGLDHLTTLLLNYNNIKNLSSKCFRTLQNLRRLDLSFNKIETLDFEKEDLYNLLSLSLRNNHLTVVRHENFHGLNSLQYLDLSDNKISQVETNSFISLKELINFEISNNPLSGTLKEKTFDGLNSLPSLDISCTLLSIVQNGSFVGMVQLKNLNVSHSKINILEYNIFLQTGIIETIDLSFNELNEFTINSTELAALDTLYLNNNKIKTLDSTTFQNIPRLKKLTLSYNMIQNVDIHIFSGQRYLRMLDMSFNTNLKFTLSLVNKTKNVDILNLSGVKTGISFGNIKDISLSKLTISNANVSDVKTLQINELQRLDTLTLSFNDISKIEDGSFNNISNLRIIDLSYNKIVAIQPGVFRDNTMLMTLNVSHNFLTALSYGIFRGLIYLDTLDISFNEITDLRNERFYEVKSLSVLVADHNKIESINAEEFIGTSLTQLSIGGNPIPCEVLAKMNVPFEITASRLYENNDENIHGVTCNKKSHMFDRIMNVGTPNTDSSVKVLLNIRDIMLDHLNQQPTSKPVTSANESYLTNITDQILTSNEEASKKISNFINVTKQIIANNNNNETNTLLNKILKVLTLSSVTRAPPIQVTKDNATYENLLSYINKVREEIEVNMKLDKDSILSEVEAKISEVDSRTIKSNVLHSTEMPKHEKLSASADSKSLFTEICVALILVILVGFVLFKVYKSRMYVRQNFSVSTRELPGAMDSVL